MNKTRKKSIGLIFLIIAIVLAIASGIAGYHSMHSQMMAKSFLVALFFFVIACIFLRRSFSVKSILVRMFFVFLLMYAVLSLHFISNPNMFSLIFLLVWAIFSIQGFFYYPKKRKFMGLTFLLLGLGVVTIFFIIENNAPIESDLPLITDFPIMICGFTSVSLIILGLFYLIPLSKKNNRPESSRFLILYMSIVGFVGIITAILKGLDSGLFGFFGTLGWILVVMFLPWLLYKLRFTRLFILWAFTFPNLIANMGIYRIPSFSDFKKYVFPRRLHIHSSKDKTVTKNQSGFTLIEVLIAIAILAILSVGIINTFSMVMVGSRHLELQNQAVIIAQNELEQLKTQSSFNVNANNTISLSNRFKEWTKSVPGGSGRITVSNYKDTPLKQVQVNVQWMEGARKESVELTTILGGGKP